MATSDVESAEEFLDHIVETYWGDADETSALAVEEWIRQREQLAALESKLARARAEALEEAIGRVRATAGYRVSTGEIIDAIRALLGGREP